MKAKVIYLIVGIVLVVAGCDKNCKIKYPKDVKPIDWENYNDVYTAFWNTYSTISESSNMLHREIMVYGWVLPKYSEYGFTLVTDTYDSDKSLRLIGKPHFEVWAPVEKLDSCDLTKKCYVKGKLDFNRIKVGLCGIAIPEIKVMNIDDFYFE